MIVMHSLNEEQIEALFWEFDENRCRSGDERGEFKKALRQFARDTLDRAGVAHDILISDGTDEGVPQCPAKSTLYDDMSLYRLWFLWMVSIVTPGDDRWKTIGAAIENKGPRKP